MKSKTNIQAATFAFIATQRNKKIKSALVSEFVSAVRVLMQRAEFTFNDFLGLTKPNAVMVNIFFAWIDAIKEQKLLRQLNRNWNFPTWQINNL